MPEGIAQNLVCLLHCGSNSVRGSHGLILVADDVSRHITVLVTRSTVGEESVAIRHSAAAGHEERRYALLVEVTVFNELADNRQTFYPAPTARVDYVVCALYVVNEAQNFLDERQTLNNALGHLLHESGLTGFAASFLSYADDACVLSSSIGCIVASSRGAAYIASATATAVTTVRGATR